MPDYALSKYKVSTSLYRSRHFFRIRADVPDLETLGQGVSSESVDSSVVHNPMSTMKLTYLLVALVIVVLGIASATSDIDAPIVRVNLPFGSQPEGLASGPGPTVFAGVLAGVTPPGLIYKLDIRKRTIVRTYQAEAEGGIATIVGLWYDKKTDLLVAAARTQVLVLDATSGKTVKACPIEGSAFVNDVVTRREIIYATDSMANVIYSLPLTGSDCTVESYDLGLEPIPGEFTYNGIVKYRGQLLVGDLFRGLVFAVDLKTFKSKIIIKNVPGADGLVVRGNSLYVIKNRFNAIVEFKLSTTDGGMVKADRIRKIRNSAFRFPTTGAFSGKKLCVANGRFDEFPPFGEPAPESIFDVVCFTP